MATKTCRKCSQEKDLSLFYRHVGYKDGRRASCKECEDSYHRGHRNSNKKRNVRYAMKAYYQRKFGLSLEEVEDLKMRAGGCEICGTSSRRLALDHRHGSDTVRGVLCTNCNVAIGMLEENVDIIYKVIAYLRERNNV